MDGYAGMHYHFPFSLIAFQEINLKNKNILHTYCGGGFLVKTGGAGRIIVNHIGSADGFLSNGGDIFISKKDSRGYHKSMNADTFLEWFERVVRVVPDKSVVVLDLAPYHRKRVTNYKYTNTAIGNLSCTPGT